MGRNERTPEDWWHRDKCVQRGATRPGVPELEAEKDRRRPSWTTLLVFAFLCLWGLGVGNGHGLEWEMEGDIR